MAHKKHHHSIEYLAIEGELKSLQSRIETLQGKGENVDQLLALIAQCKTDFLATKNAGGITPDQIATLSAALKDLDAAILAGATAPPNPGGKPAITSISPTSGPIGSAFTVAGSGFGVGGPGSSLTVGGVTASVTGPGNDTSLSATVPSGVALGSVPVVVTTPNGSTAGDSSSFTVTP